MNKEELLIDIKHNLLKLVQSDLIRLETKELLFKKVLEIGTEISKMKDSAKEETEIQFNN